MAHYETGPNLAAPVGINRYKRSTKGLKTNSHTCAAATVPSTTLPSGEVIKVLQPGTVMARITSGSDIGKVGPYAASLAGVFESAELDLASASAGDFTLTISGVETAAIAYDALLAAVQAAVALVSSAVTVTEDSSNVYILTWNGSGNQPDITLDDAGISGGTATLTVTQGSASPLVADGRQTAANIVGVNDTYLPTQLARRDVEIAVVYRGELIQDWCIEHNSSMAPIALTNTTADTMRSTKRMDLLFFPVNPEVV